MSSAIGAIVGLLQERPPLSIGPEIIWNEGLDRKIAALPLTEGDEEKRAYEIALKGALLIYNDSLSKGHDVLQDELVYARNDTAGYWHGIMHRKEGDYHNAKNWCPKSHPIHEALLQKVHSYVQSQMINNNELRISLQDLASKPTWNPSVFVDIIKKNTRNGLDEEGRVFLNTIQKFEVDLLLNFTYEKAVGKTFDQLVS